jgi:opacity protein-like surface antigen
MTRIVSKFGIAAALTLVSMSTAAAQRTTSPTTSSTVSKGEVVTRVDTVRTTVHDTVYQYRRDTIRVAGPTTTMTHYDTTMVEMVPGWLGRGEGAYFGLGAGSYYPSAGLGGGQIPGYAFQMNLGVDPMGSPLGFRVTAQLARPDEAQPTATLGARPSIWNATADLKLRLPFLGSTRFPNFGLYAVGGAAYVRGQDVRYTTEPPKTVQIVKGSTSNWGYDAGGGATLSLGHKRELFLEARVINYKRSDAFENAHQLPLILGINWY